MDLKRCLTLALAGVLVLGAVACTKNANQKDQTAEEAAAAQPSPPAGGSKDDFETTKIPTEGDIEGGEAARVQSRMEDIFFDFDRYNLREDALVTMSRNYQALLDHPRAKVEIEGHCDERGTTEYNLALGERRAKAARDYLVRAGVDSSRITTVSYGEERPVDPGHEEAAWAKNRRAHFRVVAAN